MVSAVSSSERIVLKDMTCPVIRLDKSRRRDKSVSFSISLFLHGLIFAMVGLSFIKPPQFGVDQGVGGIEVTLVAAPAQEVMQEPMETPELIKSDIPEKETVKPETKVIEKQTSPETKGKDQATVQSTRGALTEAKPDYFQNPAPEYPLEARQKGWQGTVLLKVLVSKQGDPITVDIEQGSSHALLDRTAVKAVKKWKFKPAQLGNVPMESSVRVPVRFDLKRS